MENTFVDSLIQSIGPRFRDDLRRLEADHAGADVQAKAAVSPAGLVAGSGLLARLAEPVLRAAAALILQRIRDEALVVLDAEKAAHPGWDLVAVQRFFDTLGPSPTKARG